MIRTRSDILNSTRQTGQDNNHVNLDRGLTSTFLMNQNVLSGSHFTNRNTINLLSCYPLFHMKKELIPDKNVIRKAKHGIK